MISFYRRPVRNPRQRYLVNSLPKSGTHLLAKLFDLVGYQKTPDLTLTYGQFRNADAARGDEAPGYLPVGVTRTVWVAREALSRTLRSLRPGDFVLAHLPYHPGWPALLARHDVGIATIFRDPRDVTISNADAVQKNPRNWLHTHFQRRYRTREQQLAAMISGFRSTTETKELRLKPLAARLEMVFPWHVAPYGLSTRFEELVGPRGGGDRATQLRTLSRLLSRIAPGMELDRESHWLSAQLFDERSNTFNRGRIGRWRDEFSDDLHRMLDGSVSELADRLGYRIDSAV